MNTPTRMSSAISSPIWYRRAGTAALYFWQIDVSPFVPDRRLARAVSNDRHRELLRAFLVCDGDLLVIPPAEDLLDEFLIHSH